MCSSDLYDFPEANIAIIKSLQLPDKYLITGKFIDANDYVAKLKNALEHNIRLVQLRLKPDSCKNEKQLQTILTQTSNLCRQFSAKLMLNLPDEYLEILSLNQIAFDGYHLDSKKLSNLSAEPSSVRNDGKLLSASCHNEKELQKAIKLNADFGELSPVQKTASHPEIPALGWQAFSAMVEPIHVPVYALGGVAEGVIETAWKQGARGVAAISAFWS